MHDIWAFLLQTLTVSLVALFLLVLKAIFQDKLSPRWQYGVWLILAARLLIPAGFGGQMLLPLERWVELLKLAAEVRLSSAYTGVWATTAVTAPFPRVTAVPQSVTDWLFCLYAAGVVLSLLWFFLGYLRLRRTLTPAPDRAVQVERVARQYNLPLPRVAEAPIPSAFVCSPLRPVLVLPGGMPVDDKVILHELLHLKYGDLWLNLLSCLLRCLHWCNPFLWKVFDRVGNDAEALCDQRVLERLEGEDRRDYGRILLSMADDRYARLPGTTSMANGGRNIKARIRSIARFKRYPGGMALVSLCIVAILIPSCLTGTAGAAQLPSVSPRGPGPAGAGGAAHRPAPGLFRRPHLPPHHRGRSPGLLRQGGHQQQRLLPGRRVRRGEAAGAVPNSAGTQRRNLGVGQLLSGYGVVSQRSPRPPL